jgi:hypothetical protein
MNENAARWVRRLPIRWGLGGLVIGLVWSISSSALQGGFSNPVGGQAAALFRIFALVVLPLGVLGFAWGCSERFLLEHVFGSDRLDRTVRRSPLRQTGEAMICGVIFGLFTYGLGVFRSFRPWDSEPNITANLSAIFAFALLAAPLGLLVGVVSRRNLLRRISNI